MEWFEMEQGLLINKKIAAFYTDIPKLKNLEVATKCLNIEHTLIVFKSVLHDFQNRFGINLNDFECLNYEDFVIIWQELQPIFSQSHCLMVKCNLKEFHLSWLGDINPIEEVFNCNQVERNGTGQIEKILLLTSMLEFALGSIFCTVSQQRMPPHLLKDLLNTKELETCFDLETIQFLKILLGTPKSINLRNIVWHGFPWPKTFPKYYVSVLLISIHTMGHMILEKQLKINYRNRINDFSTQLSIISAELDMPPNFCIEQFKLNLHACDIIPLNYKPYWFQIFYYLKNSKYWRLVILILPQIELILRLLYAKSNNYDVSAKLDEYYITLETIFEQTVPDTVHENSNIRFNNLLNEKSIISQGTLQLIFDLFLAPKGPRLRDKVSHGEVATAAIDNKQLCHILLHLSFNLITQNEMQYPLANYESKFHLNSLAKFALNEAVKTFINFVQAFEIKFVTIKLVFNFNAVRIFRRPKKEATHMLLVYKIAELLTETCNNFKASINFRQSMLVQYELHSKRRRTLENLMKSLPEVCTCLNTILDCLLRIFVRLQNANETCDIDDSLHLQRFLKHCLKIAQSFAKYSHKDSNEWIKAMESCTVFNKLYENYFFKWIQSEWK